MSEPTALGVYIFAGGHTLGVRKHFKVLAHFEDGPFGTATVRHNMPDIPIHTNPDTWPADDFVGRVDYLYGNPPCAPWSAAGHLPKQKQKLGEGMHKYMFDARVKCVENQFALLGRIRPKVWSWESVARAYSVGRAFVDQLTERALDQGYSVTHLLMNAVDCGCPQIRRRFFFVAHNIELGLERPNVPHRTVRDAIEWIYLAGREGVGYNPGQKYLDLASRARPGEGLQDAWHRENPPETWQRNKSGGVIGRPGFLATRLSWDKPAGTMIGGAHQYHPELARLLTVKEAQVICSYPYEYEFIYDNVGDAYSQIAKAVTPAAGDWLGSQVRRAVDRNVPESKPQVHTVDFLRKQKNG